MTGRDAQSLGVAHGPWPACPETTNRLIGIPRGDRALRQAPAFYSVLV